MANLENTLRGKNSRERVALKTQAFADRKTEFEGEFHDEGYGIAVRILSLVPIDGGISVLAQAFKNGKPIGFGADGRIETERFRFFNPPILVDDQNGPIVRAGEMRFGGSYERRLREDPIAALRQSLSHTIYVSHKNIRPQKGTIGNTTSTFYPDPHTESTSVDGYAGRFEAVGGVSFASLSGAAGNDANDTATADLFAMLAAGNVTDQWRYLYRGATLFDTSAIPDTDTIASATVSLNGTAKTATLNATTIAPYSVTLASNTAVATGDYAVANWGTTAFATGIAIGSWNTSGFNDFALNATGLAAITKTGVTKIGWRTTADATGTPPTWSASVVDQFTGNYADNSGTSADPKLVVVHAAAGPAASRRSIICI